MMEFVWVDGIRQPVEDDDWQQTASTFFGMGYRTAFPVVENIADPVGFHRNLVEKLAATLGRSFDRGPGTSSKLETSQPGLRWRSSAAGRAPHPLRPTTGRHPVVCHRPDRACRARCHLWAWDLASMDVELDLAACGPPRPLKTRGRSGVPAR
jgi:hypothetical protein